MKPNAQITARFVKAMHTIIMQEKTSGGDITSVKAFAESIGHSSSNFSKFTGKYRRSVTIEQVEAICKKYRVSPNYLILGIGGMFLEQKDSYEARLKRLERRVLQL